MPTLRPTALALATLAALGLAPAASHAQRMQATLTGTVSAGGDAYRNTVYFGPNGGGNLVGQVATVRIVYDAAAFGANQYGGNYYSVTHQPNYPAFLGTAGQSPVKSADFTVNGFTFAMDVAGAYETARLSVENPPDAGPYGQPDSWTLAAGDRRSTWCPNDGQCAESLQLHASQTYASSDLFGGQRSFSPADAFTVTPAPYRSAGAYVRLMQSNGACPAGVCPEARFADNATHWVEFYVDATRLSVAAVVPEPGTWALMLGGLALAGGVARRRQRA